MEESWAQPSDAELIDACLEGDDKAWRSLVMRYKRLVYSVPTRWGLSADDSVDIFQSVWLDCFRQLSSFRKIERLQPWLIRVAIRKCHRFSQTTRARREDQLDQEAVLTPSAEDPGKLMTELDRDQTLRMAMERLPPRCKEVLRLLFFEDPKPSYQAIATRLGLSENSIGFTRERCLNNLRRILNDLGYDA
jgi:RNA polymerase sigma factor (sigma-70 family)